MFFHTVSNLGIILPVLDQFESVINYILLHRKQSKHHSIDVWSGMAQWIARQTCYRRIAFQVQPSVVYLSTQIIIRIT